MVRLYLGYVGNLQEQVGGYDSRVIIVMIIIGWLVGWLVGWLAGWLVGWLARCLKHQQHAKIGGNRSKNTCFFFGIDFPNQILFSQKI